MKAEKKQSAKSISQIKPEPLIPNSAPQLLQRSSDRAETDSLFAKSLVTSKTSFTPSLPTLSTTKSAISDNKQSPTVLKESPKSDSISISPVSHKMEETSKSIHDLEGLRPQETFQMIGEQTTLQQKELKITKSSTSSSYHSYILDHTVRELASKWDKRFKERNENLLDNQMKRREEQKKEMQTPK